MKRRNEHKYTATSIRTDCPFRERLSVAEFMEMFPIDYERMWKRASMRERERKRVEAIKQGKQ